MAGQLFPRPSDWGRRSVMTTFTCSASTTTQPLECAMSRYVAPLGFTLAATWVATIFLLIAK